MKSLSFLSAVFKLRISGVINSKTLSKLHRDLSKWTLHSPLMLAVTVNSPGGSAAISSIIRKYLRCYSLKHSIPVYTFAEDLATSGGYYIMTAGDTLYANPTSLIGSIGAQFNTFLLKDLAEKYGVERRSWASNEYVLDYALDPLGEIGEKARGMIGEMLGASTAEFVGVVEESRGGKLRVPSEKRGELIYNGDVFSAGQAAEIGLVDRIGNCDDFISEVYSGKRVIDLSKEGIVEKFREYFD